MNVDKDILAKAAFELHRDVGSLSDFPSDLRNTITSLYYEHWWFQLSQKPTQGHSSWTRNVIARKGHYELVPALVRSMREIRKDSESIFEMTLGTTRDLLRYNIKNVTRKSAARRALEKIFRRAYFEVPGIYDLADSAVSSAPTATDSRYLRERAEQGDADAQFKLALMYGNGSGVEKNLGEAAVWFRCAGEQGDHRSQFALGTMYAEGRGVDQDYAEAAKWLHLAADQGYPEAQSNLGTMYVRGLGVAKDDRRGAIWLRRAAEAGFAKAQFALGNMYAEGRGVGRDYGEAAAWLSRAAARGVDEAELELLRLYAGIHVLADTSAAQAGDGHFAAIGRQMRDALASSMTRKQIAAARRLARQVRRSKP